MYTHYHNLYFTTATILEWKHLLRFDNLKKIVIDSLRYMSNSQKAVIYAFVIMPNHIHLVWHIREEHTLSEVKSALLSFTAHQFKKILTVENPQELERYRVNLADRTYQFWERNPLSISILHDEVFYQKVRYVRWNPCAEHWRLANEPERYKYSSAYLAEGEPYWDFVAKG